jgi:uncharacterized protein YaiI (UPF0178 family)
VFNTEAISLARNPGRELIITADAPLAECTLRNSAMEDDGTGYDEQRQVLHVTPKKIPG